MENQQIIKVAFQIGMLGYSMHGARITVSIKIKLNSYFTLSTKLISDRSRFKH